MPDRRDRDRYDRPSWKEIDRKKDRSTRGNTAGGRGKLDERKVTTGYHKYRSDLDSLFSTGEASKMVKEVMSKAPVASDGKEGKSKGPPRRQKLLRGIRDCSSTSQLVKLLDEFLGEWDMPDDIEFLTQALDHPDEDVQREALERISAYLDGHVPERASTLRTRAKRLASRSDDENVAGLARQVVRKLPL